jgi:sugar-phosphatase
MDLVCHPAGICFCCVLRRGRDTLKAAEKPLRELAYVDVAAKGLLFDMDGVLISSIASVNRCWRRWAAHYEVPNADKFVIAHGTRAVDIIVGLRPDFGPEQIAVGLRLIEDMEIDDMADLKVLPGVKALLGGLPQNRWTIVTSATRRLTLARLAEAGLPVPELLIAGDDVTHGKPHPEPYLTGARRLGFAPEECVVVEDAPSGVGSGKAAGSRVLGVLGTHRAEELYAAGAEWVTASLAGVWAGIAEDGLKISFEAVHRA